MIMVLISQWKCSIDGFTQAENPARSAIAPPVWVEYILYPPCMSVQVPQLWAQSFSRSLILQICLDSFCCANKSQWVSYRVYVDAPEHQIFQDQCTQWSRLLVSAPILGLVHAWRSEQGCQLYLASRILSLLKIWHRSSQWGWDYRLQLLWQSGLLWSNWRCRHALLHYSNKAVPGFKLKCLRSRPWVLLCRLGSCFQIWIWTLSRPCSRHWFLLYFWSRSTAL